MSVLINFLPLAGTVVSYELLKWKPEVLGSYFVGVRASSDNFTKRS